jgi:hypothetical protein
MAAFSGEGYASGRTRKAALFDPLLGAHPFEKTRLLTDRSAYVSFLEVQLERATAACLATQGFSERIEQLQTQISRLEAKIGNRHFQGAPQISACTCQATCARLADDALAAVTAVDDKLELSEKNFQRKLSEISAKVLDLLRQVVARQRDMQLKISGNLDISDLPLEAASAEASTPSATLRLAGEIPGERKLQQGARVRATSAPGAAAAQARRRKAVDELTRELELLEKEGN